MNRIQLKKLLNETSVTPYSYGCVMLYLDFPKIQLIHNLIVSNDIYNIDDVMYGLEKDPHITLLYGLHSEVTEEQVKKICERCEFTDVIAYNVSLFEAENYDVLKFDIRYPNRSGAFLTRCNRMLRELPHTSTYPTYHPHLTIAYVKSGKGKKYVELMKNIHIRLSPSHIEYSKADGHRIKIKL
jgi:hypothetical protein